jgi:hypothetical protein
MPNKMKSNNPPRRVDIRGQDHLLAYITPAEAQLLMDNGGTGEPGPMGIPAFFDPGERDQLGGAQGDRDVTGRGGGGRSEDRDAAVAAAQREIDRAARDADRDREIAAEIANRQAYEAKMGGISPGQATAMFGDARMAGRGFTSADIDRVLGDATVSRAALAGMLPELQARARRGQQISTLAGALSPVTTAIRGIFDMPRSRTSYDDLSTLPGMPDSRIQPGGFLAPDAVLAAPTGGVGAFGTPANLSQGYFGQVTYTGMPNADYTGPYANLVNPRDPNMGGDGREVVPTQTNPVTGEQQCPEGYVFDADLQACRLDTALQNVGDTVGGDGFTYEPGTYARMGLLDVAPEDLGGFASTYGTGFGTKPDFESANLDYRRRAGTQAGIFQDPYNLEGMTLLA